MAHKKIFDKKYFTDYYFAMTGAFTKADFIRNYNWFYGWFEAINSFFPMKNGEGRKAIEIGCSIGSASQILSEYGYEVTATDISSYAVKNAKKLLPHIECEVLDVMEKPKKKHVGSYDLLFAFEVIEHLDRPQKALENMYSMLAKNGKVILSTPYPYSYVYYDETHVSVLYPGQWAQLLKAAGFTKIGFRQIGFVPYFYRFSKHLHIRLPFGVNSRYINSPIFLYATK